MTRSTNNRSFWCFSLALVLSVLAAGSAFASDVAYRAALASTGLIFDNDSSGTVWVIDTQRRLAITNYHVVREKQEMKVYFSDVQDNRVVQSFEYYRDNINSVKAKILVTDKTHDLALVQLERLPANVRALPLSPSEPAVGEKLFNLGYDAGARVMFVWHQTEVTKQSYKGLYINTVGTIASPVVEVKPVFRNGFSGGPVINARGQVIGAVTGSKTTIDRGYVIKAASIQAFVNKAIGVPAVVTAKPVIKTPVVVKPEASKQASAKPLPIKTASVKPVSVAPVSVKPALNKSELSQQINALKGAVVQPAPVDPAVVKASAASGSPAKETTAKETTSKEIAVKPAAPAGPVQTALYVTLKPGSNAGNENAEVPQTGSP